MDPTACYREMYEAMRDRDLFTARERALALKSWLDKGCFLPDGHSRQQVEMYLASVLHRTANCTDQ